MPRLILILSTLLILSCTTNDKSESYLEQNIYDSNKLQDYELFEKANNLISNNQLNLALIELDKLDVLFPSTIYANKGMLMTAYIHFLNKDYEKTRAIAENYKKYYPGSKDIVYANYLDAMTYYIAIKKPEYSQKNSYEAIEKLNFILNAYPNSKYEIDIVTKIQIIDNNLANHKISVAKFYFNKQNLNASLIYLKDIFENHSSSLSIEEALYYLTKIYKSLDEINLAKKYAAILGYNFPESKWYEKAYNIVNDIETINEKDNWYKNFNPIKLFINDPKEDSFEIRKID